MTIEHMHWAEVESAAARDPRAVLPIGSTEQHAQLSLSVDTILAQKVAREAAEPLGCFGADWQSPGEILFGNRGAVVVGEMPETILTDDI